MSDPGDAARLARDHANRSRALAPDASFLVQAPAGSGKTELLIQRYLALLARVAAPQRVVAMTFTRKAASEMRERVVGALQAARDERPVTEPHEATTRRLAHAVLAHADRQGWSLLAHPAQLAILTIDALCATLASEAPVTSRLGPSLRIVERAEVLHGEAARAVLGDVAGDDPHWRRLLAHLDNDAELVVGLVASLLGRRDQWLPHLVRRDAPALRAELERALQVEIEAELGAALARGPATLLAAIAQCAGRAAAVLRADGGDAELAAALERCAGQGGLPSARYDALASWRGVAGWLLTKEGGVRRKVTKAEGIRTAKAGGAAERAAMEAMLADLAATPELVTALGLVRELPDARFADDAWDIVEALLHILPRAVAQLQLVFAQRGATDFTELALAAATALGAADSPSELLLRLDLTIEHLLVDEFQDTSAAQFELIALLTAGWQPGDGRTLFAVGDPMQSIYRFRNAEVRLFLQAIAAGRIGSVPVEFIDLARNFRAQPALVAWVNRLFPAILGERSEPWRGAVAFAAATAARDDGPEDPPTLDVVNSREAEAACTVDRVRAALAAGSTDIAILVRTRRDLKLILPALRAAGIAFAAVELDALAARQAVQDVLALAHALIQPADRLAALAVLRAPWCGLLLADLLVAAEHLDRGLPGLLAALPAIERLSPDGAPRLKRLARILAPAFAEHGQGLLADRVRGLWLALGGPATLDEAIDFTAVEDALGVLRTHARGGDVDDWEAVRDELTARFVTSAEEAATPVKIMTLFKAKGLEFDTVVIPGLARMPRGDDRELLRWRTRQQGLLLAPRNRRGSREAIYDYLGWLARTEADHEVGRMLYVGVTRAKRRLHLVAVAGVEVDAATGSSAWRTPSPASALGKLWAGVADRLVPPAGVPGDDLRREPAAPPLVRLPIDFALPALPASVPPTLLRAPRAARPDFEWARAEAAIVGTVTHRYLARRAADPLLAGDAARRQALVPRLRAELTAEGITDRALDAAVGDVLAALAAVAEDRRGRWLFDPTHADARSEWALAGVDGGAIVHVTLDRTFIADGVRWIVDFKTGRHEGADPEAFLAQEVLRYEPQLARYARIVHAIEGRPIRLALYHPRVPGGWREWAFAPSTPPFASA
ncbi:MAG: UvrD-helicase domain-containing protein [Burkholderiales bacterium]|nr:UvrD-helicase domain-containing protein [Burkholderiales bacterium]